MEFIEEKIIGNRSLGKSRVRVLAILASPFALAFSSLGIFLRITTMNSSLTPICTLWLTFSTCHFRPIKPHPFVDPSIELKD